MGFGLYFHIPYCQQLCPYCDFAKYKLDSTSNFVEYHSHLIKELEYYSKVLGKTAVDSIAFGGGTPSLYPTELFEDLLDKVNSLGFSKTNSCEIGMEIDPNTVSPDKLRSLKELGFQRFSVGVQSFNDGFLNKLGRKHTPKDALDLVDNLKRLGLSYSLDLLFALPKQTLSDLERDLDVFLECDPVHMSAYVLDLPPKHQMNRDRPSDEEQVKMFETIERRLSTHGLKRYEISNYAKEGCRSKHNQLYWKDGSYLGIGLSSHSYLSSLGNWGSRFWNPKTMPSYMTHIQSLDAKTPIKESKNSKELFEELTPEESLTDYSHTHLRHIDGIDIGAAQQKYGENRTFILINRLASLEEQGLVQSTNGSFSLTKDGKLLSNKVFELLTF